MGATVIDLPAIFVFVQLANIVARFVIFLVGDAGGNPRSIIRLINLYANDICCASGGICMGVDIGG